jgi:hypothetical protein
MNDNYPEVAQATTLAQQSYDLALEVKVDSAEMYEVAGDELRGIVTRRKKIEELRLSLTRPIDQAKTNIMNLFRGPTDRLAQAESLLRDEMTRYQRVEREKAEAARREAEAKAKAERAEVERREREAAEAARAAQKAGDAEAAAKAAMEAESAREQRETLEVAPPRPIATITPKAKGVSTRKNWKAEVTDFKALVLAAATRAEAGDDFLLGFLLPNDKALGTAAKSMQAKLVVPGVRAYAEDVLSVRRRAG